MLSSYVRTKIGTSSKPVLLMLPPGLKNHNSINMAHKNLTLSCKKRYISVLSLCKLSLNFAELLCCNTAYTLDSCFSCLLPQCQVICISLNSSQKNLILFAKFIISLYLQCSSMNREKTICLRHNIYVQVVQKCYYRSYYSDIGPRNNTCTYA